MDATASGPDPACAHHPESEAAWDCPACEAALCEACVRIFAGRDVRLASCKQCGGKCEPLRGEQEPQLDGLRAGAVEDEEAVRRRLLRDKHVPLGVLSGSVTLLLLLLLVGRGLEGLGLWLAVLGLAMATMAAGFWVAGLITEADFEPLGPTLLKLGATGAALHVIRLTCWAAFAPDTPGGAGPVGIAQAIGMLGPRSVTFVLAPMAVLLAAVMGLFRLDLFDRVVTVVALFLVDAFGLFFLVGMGVFG